MKNKYWRRFLYFILGLFLLCGVQFLEPTQIMAQESLQSIFDQALKDSKNGNFGQALKAWDQIIDLSPSAEAYSNRGNCLLALGDSEGAIIDQTHSLELLPNAPDAHLNRGIAQESLQRWDKAIEDYTWILDRNPEDPLALYNLANVKGSQGDWIMARNLFAKAFDLKPGFAIAQSSQALASYQLSDLEEAEKLMRTIVRKYPMFADARAALSALLWRKGLYGEAESNWVAASGLDNRYRDSEWLLHFRRWPPTPIDDLMAFLALESP